MKTTTREVTAECLCIGDELLIGQTINTNAAWMGEAVGLSGFRPVRTRVVGDDEADILDALGTARADVVLVTGGLGPTKDDITKRCLCRFFGTRLVRHPEVEAHIVELFERRGLEPRHVKEADLRQALLPESCIPMPNAVGTASGMWFEREGRVYVSMPGVPYEMQAILRDHVLPRLRERFSPPSIVHRTIRTAGIGETPLSERIAAWEEGLAADGIRLAYLPSPGQVKLRLSRYANADPVAAKAAVDRQAQALYGLIPGLIYGEGGQELEEVIGIRLKAAGQTLAVAESCTGGHVSHLITSVPGSSAYFLGGVVSYANEVKRKELDVPEALLREHGAVSRPVAERMAEGVRAALGSDWGLSTTGVAGPDGGTPETPVGLVWMAVAGPRGTVAAQSLFAGTRSLVIQRATVTALDLLRRSL
ncbi:MAG: CinA family nicotinamide mononucleotide deamidase-related protein [Flavobacteriales bacterium]|nr:CinA family nicotinamide mononucleotide deamidase-related protein [Flavobacteriales bacterium]MEB2341535.1 CinA family nicotinamide mononucleotide deamidase-related protein [Flavobacteriia bacterium]